MHTMGIPEKIKAIQDEMSKTQINKATEHHIGILKAKIAKLRREQEDEHTKKKGAKTAVDGFDVIRMGWIKDLDCARLCICLQLS